MARYIRTHGFLTAQDMQKLKLVYKYDRSEWRVKTIQSTIPVDDEIGTEVEFSGIVQSFDGDDNNLQGLAALSAAAIGIATGGSGAIDIMLRQWKVHGMAQAAGTHRTRLPSFRGRHFNPITAPISRNGRA